MKAVLVNNRAPAAVGGHNDVDPESQRPEPVGRKVPVPNVLIPVSHLSAVIVESVIDEVLVVDVDPKRRGGPCAVEHNVPVGASVAEIKDARIADKRRVDEVRLEARGASQVERVESVVPIDAVESSSEARTRRIRTRGVGLKS